MPEVLVAEPAQRDEWQQRRQNHDERTGRAAAKPAFEEDEKHDQRQDAVNHVAQKQTPME